MAPGRRRSTSHHTGPLWCPDTAVRLTAQRGTGNTPVLRLNGGQPHSRSSPAAPPPPGRPIRHLRPAWCPHADSGAAAHRAPWDDSGGSWPLPFQLLSILIPPLTQKRGVEGIWEEVLGSVVPRYPWKPRPSTTESRGAPSHTQDKRE